MFIGYDIGTKFVKAAFGEGVTNCRTIKKEHYSDPAKAVASIESLLLNESSPPQGFITGRFATAVKSEQSRLSVIDWTKPVISYCNDHYHNQIRYIIDVGAAGLSLLELRDGKFHRFVTNSICASGTGSFLDQQMLRMGLSFSDIEAMELTPRVPSIAGRCAVFAKSDLIHRQQEGYSVQELWNGLVKGMAESCYITLLRGDDIAGKILFIGGLVKNKLFLHYFSSFSGTENLIIPEQPDVFSALSCLHYAQTQQHKTGGSLYVRKLRENPLAYEPPLNPGKKETNDHYQDRFDNEIKVYQTLSKKMFTPVSSADNPMACEPQTIPVVFGVDIGSTSTKAALLHFQTGEPLLGIYRKTQGNPISAFQSILKGINSYTSENPIRFEVKGMGTTGSGRKIVGAFAGADKCVNEITAHLRGALREVPDVRTIIEIGGQDSKYILVQDGWMKDANMNYVCAAGTGSFLEEQAQNLNFSLDEFEDLCRGVPAPKANDRCTVFMEQDSRKLLVDGHTKSEVVASLLYSVCRNYLHRVVQNRPIEEPILFLGATARNKGLVEAFSNILQKNINTSPNSHLTGAIGVAEIIRELMSTKADAVTQFKGFGLHSADIRFKEFNCRDCHNNCRIIYFDTDSGRVSWGYQCGKEGVDKKRAEDVSKTTTSDYFLKTKGILSLYSKINIGHDAPPSQQKENASHTYTSKSKILTEIYIPPALSFYSHNKLWTSFWEELNVKVRYPSANDEEVLNTALNYSPNEICFPLKMAIGHIIAAVKREQAPLFVPYLIKDTKVASVSNSYLCPMTQALPALVTNIMQYNKLPDAGVMSPVIDLSREPEFNINSLWNCLKQHSSFTKNQIKNAFNKASTDFQQMHHNLLEEGSKTIAEIVAQTGGKSSASLVIIGRAYNLYDNSLNLGLIKEAAKFGYPVIPADLIPVTREQGTSEFPNMYWAYGQKVIAIAKELLRHPNLFPIFLTNFNCGPDSFILSMLEEIWQTKPYLILELDEHSGNAGYLTRIEAFLDRIESYKGDSIVEHKQTANKSFPKQAPDNAQNPDRTLLIPPMNVLGTTLFSSAFRNSGYNAIPLVKENADTFQLGKSYLRGSECLPAASTLGSVVDYCRTAKQAANLSVFMPCASGPCRFGQYGNLHALVFKRNKIDAEILAVSSENNYAGFSTKLRMKLFNSMIITDLLIKLGCKLRPYEKHPGEIDELLQKYLSLFATAIEKDGAIIPLLRKLRQSIDLLGINLNHSKPLVGIVGEIYVRVSDFSNNNLIRKIEDYNAEAWLTPFMEWIHYTTYLKTLNKRGLKSYLSDSIASVVVNRIEAKYYDCFRGILSSRQEPQVEEMLTKARRYMSDAIRGEAILTIGRSLSFIEQGAKMIVNVAPFGCMPGTISSIILKKIAFEYSIPIVSLYYDGFTGFDVQLEQYLNNL